jgi:hypothetical protein
MRFELKHAGAAVVAGFVALGCHKNDDQAGAAAPQSPPPAQVGKAEATGATAADSGVKIDTGGGFLVARKAIDANDYVTASVALLKMDPKSLTPQEAAKNREAMHELHRKVVDGVARGDEKAIEAMQLLRASAAH